MLNLVYANEVKEVGELKEVLKVKDLEVLKIEGSNTFLVKDGELQRFLKYDKVVELLKERNFIDVLLNNKTFAFIDETEIDDYLNYRKKGKKEIADYFIRFGFQDTQIKYKFKDIESLMNFLCE